MMLPRGAAHGGLAVLTGVVLAALVSPTAAGMTRYEYVFVSQPRLSSVVYIKIDKFLAGEGNETEPIVTAGLQKPMGLAVDHNRQRLFIADLESEKVFMYKLHFEEETDTIHTDGHQYVAASGLKPRWISVDEIGNLYATDEEANVVMKVTETQLSSSDPSPAVMYSGSSLASVSKPSGIVADGADIFWGNKEAGEQKGSVVKGKEDIDTEDVAAGVHKLAHNVDSVYGVCASEENIYYTGVSEFIYGVKKGSDDDAAAASDVSDILEKPRGCTWDNDGTIFVADRGGNAIFSFPSAMKAIGPAEISRVWKMEDPFGLAVYRPPTPGALEMVTAVRDPTSLAEDTSQGLVSWVGSSVSMLFR